MTKFLCKAEYTKSQDDICTGCKIHIEEGAIRFAKVYHTTELRPKWYDFQCFLKSALIKSVEEVENFQNLRLKDKEEIRKELATASKKNKSKRSDESAKDPAVEHTEAKRSKPGTSKPTDSKDETKTSGVEVAETLPQKANVTNSELESLMKKQNDVTIKIQSLKNHTVSICQLYNQRTERESGSGFKETFIDSACDLATPLQELMAVMIYTEAMKKVVPYEQNLLHLKLLESGTTPITSAISFLNMLRRVQFDDDKEAFLTVTNELNNVLSCDYGIRTISLRNKGLVSFPMRALTNQDVDKFYNLLNFQIAFDMLSSVERISPIQDYYNKLNTMITFVNKVSKEFKDIAKYVENSQCKDGDRYSIEAVFKVDRHEENRLKNFNDRTNRYLLWHGTGIANLSSILAQGLKAKNGAQNGIFFADRICKSAQYCYNEESLILFLCEVALGEIYQTSSFINRPEKHLDSIKQIGRMQPDMLDVGETETGALIPFGKSLENPCDSKSQLEHNEFVIHDPSQVRLRYLVKIKTEFDEIGLSIGLCCMG